jgi:hypothetical protein
MTKLPGSIINTLKARVRSEAFGAAIRLRLTSVVLPALDGYRQKA